MMGNRSALVPGGRIMRISMTACAVAFAVLAASAQDAQGRAKLLRRGPLRVEVAPSGRLYRQCTDWHVIEHRATGDTVVPRARCWWALQR